MPTTHQIGGNALSPAGGCDSVSIKRRLLVFSHCLCPPDQADRERKYSRASLGVIPVQRSHACVKALVCWYPSSQAICETVRLRSRRYCVARVWRNSSIVLENRTPSSLSR